MTPQQQAFPLRLEPERSIGDLDQRSARALSVLAEAAAAGDWALMARALARAQERWAEREQLAPAPAWLWQGRYQALDAALVAAPVTGWAVDSEVGEAMAALWRAWYYTAARGGGMSGVDADVFAVERTANWRALAR